MLREIFHLSVLMECMLPLGTRRYHCRAAHWKIDLLFVFKEIIILRLSNKQKNIMELGKFIPCINDWVAYTI